MLLLRCQCRNDFVWPISAESRGGDDAALARWQEFLGTASEGEEPLLLGRRHFAQMALVRVQSLRCAELMRQLIARPGTATRLEEGALLLVRELPTKGVGQGLG